MERLYTIEGNYIEIILNKEIYPLVSIKKAITNFMEDAYIKINDISKKEYMLQVKVKEDNKDLEKIIGEFYNELLRESLRYSISVETKNLRELIVGRALYTTCIDLEEEQKESIEEKNDVEESEDYSLDEIAVNWFEKHENEEE